MQSANATPLDFALILGEAVRPPAQSPAIQNQRPEGFPRPLGPRHDGILRRYRAMLPDERWDVDDPLATDRRSWSTCVMARADGTKGSDGDRPRVLDANQLVRIEAVHRGFLFQHLYAVQLLLAATSADATSIVIEGDEDVEIVAPSHRTYVQMKFRSTSLGIADIADALVRFGDYRALHADGSRPGTAAFVVATNASPTLSLSRVMEGAGWNGDTFVDHPGASPPRACVTPPPSRTIEEAFEACRSFAARLPFAILSPETLVWKLAGQVAMAACGGGARRDHSFQVDELPALFEQLVIRLQELPSPPANYRAQSDEPTIAGEVRCRLIVGHSGAGKTSWVAQAAQHATGDIAYFDVGDIPGSALASSLSRELAARYGGSGGGLGRVLLPGASGLDILRGIGRGLAEAGSELTVVLDDAHRQSPIDLLAVVRAAPQVRFTVVAQPGSGMSELAASLGVAEERLGGWTCDTIAAEAAASGCRADAATAQALAGADRGPALSTSRTPWQSRPRSTAAASRTFARAFRP